MPHPANKVLRKYTDIATKIRETKNYNALEPLNARDSVMTLSLVKQDFLYDFFKPIAESEHSLAEVMFAIRHSEYQKVLNDLRTSMDKCIVFSETLRSKNAAGEEVSMMNVMNISPEEFSFIKRLASDDDFYEFITRNVNYQSNFGDFIQKNFSGYVYPEFQELCKPCLEAYKKTREACELYEKSKLLLEKSKKS